MVKTLPTTGPTTARRPHSLATERKLMAAVITLLDTQGLDACTAPAVARQAGVAVGTIYARYEDKDTLIRAALLDMISLGSGTQDGEIIALVDEARDLPDFIVAITRRAMAVVREHRTLLLAVREFVSKSKDVAWRDAFTQQQGHARRVLFAAAAARFANQIHGGESALRLALAAIYGAVEVTWLDPAAGLFEAPPSPDAFVAAIADMQVRYLVRP